MQRSCGYADRRTLTIADIERAVQVIKGVSPSCVVAVDNCYGEFTEAVEPCTVRPACTLAAFLHAVYLMPYIMGWRGGW